MGWDCHRFLKNRNTPRARSGAQNRAPQLARLIVSMVNHHSPPSNKKILQLTMVHLRAPPGTHCLGRSREIPVEAEPAGGIPGTRMTERCPIQQSLPIQRFSSAPMPYFCPGSPSSPGPQGRPPPHLDRVRCRYSSKKTPPSASPRCQRDG
jgi:hypothetical protein